jgi:hypothetical protein
MPGLEESLSGEPSNTTIFDVAADTKGPAIPLLEAELGATAAAATAATATAAWKARGQMLGHICAGVSSAFRSAIQTLLVAPRIAVAPTLASRDGTGTEATNKGAASSRRSISRSSLPWR